MLDDVSCMVDVEAFGLPDEREAVQLDRHEGRRRSGSMYE